MGSYYRSVHAVWQMLAFFLLLPRAAGILSWESPIIRAHPLIPHSSPSLHPCKRNSSLEKSLHGRGILPFWGLLCHCPNYSPASTGPCCISSLHRFLRCSGGCVTRDLSSAQASGTIAAVSEGFPEDVGEGGGRPGSFVSGGSNICFEQCVD